jgi:predicted HD phosphohydrolase
MFESFRHHHAAVRFLGDVSPQLYVDKEISNMSDRSLL